MQNIEIFITLLVGQFLNLDFLVSLNLLHMLLSFTQINFGVQDSKDSYESFGGAIAPLGLSQKCRFLARSQFFI